MKDHRPDSRDVDRIREMLERAAPQDSRVVGRADAVVRRARAARARNGVVGAVAVGVAAAAVIVGPQFVDSSPVTHEGTDPTNSATTTSSNPAAPAGPDPYANPCPSSPIQVSDPPQAGVLEPDTAMVRLCRASVAGVSSRWEPPADALVIGVDDFAARVADLREFDLDLAYCAAARVPPRPFALQITDSAGETQTASSPLTGCGTISINSKDVGAQGVLAFFRQALTQQRTRLEPQVADTPLECHDTRPPVRLGWISEVTAQTRFIAAITCASDESERPGAAPPSAIELLNQEWAANARDLRVVKPLRVDRCPLMDVVRLPTYVMTAWGDVVRMRMAACGDYRIGSFQLVMSEALLKALSLPYQPNLNWTVPGN